MRNVLTALIAIPVAAFIYGCNTGTLTEMARIQGEQAAEIDKITELIEEQNENVAALRKQADADVAMRTKLKEAIKAKLANGSQKDELLQAALLLVNKGSSTVSSQAINILGYLGGEKAEKALLKMLDSGSFNRNSSSIINALVSMRSNKLRSVVIKLLDSGNYQSIQAATNVLQNRSVRILKKSDLPLLLKALDDIPNDNNNRHRRNQMIRVLCKLDQDTGVKYICDEMETADVNQQRELLYIPIHGGVSLKAKSWKKLIASLDEPNSRNMSSFQAACEGISRCGDLRMIEIALPWAEFAKINSNFRSSYINMLNRLRDPKSAKVFLDLCVTGKNAYYVNYLKNFPGIIQKDGKYQLVDDAEMKKLIKNRDKIIARLNARDKKKAAAKKK